MKTKKTLYTVITLLLFAWMFWASKTSKQTTTTVKTYEEVNKKDVEPYDISYDLPIITPTKETKQTQRKGGVTITCEVIPFDVSINDNVKREIYYADPNMPGYDVFQVSHTPSPNVNPKNFLLNIKIKNNQERILKVRETALLLQVDGLTYHIPEASLTDWYAGMIIKNGEFNYKIQGPEFNSLVNAKLLYLFINDVPTIMDEGGNIKKRENFEWYFECKKESVQKQAQKTYSYETSPIETRQCEKCGGTGTDPTKYQCSTCKGTGQTKNIFDGKYYTCSTCKGSGIVHYKCSNCSGQGILSFPKSMLPRETSSTSWTGWPVNVSTNPPGAVVKVVNTKTKSYYDAGTANCTVDWNTSNSTSYPIIVEYQGKSIKVLPYNGKGKQLTKVVVDFSSGQPVVKEGSLAN